MVRVMLPRIVAPVGFLETSVIYCDDNLRRLSQFPPECVDLIYLDPPLRSHLVLPRCRRFSEKVGTTPRQHPFYTKGKTWTFNVDPVGVSTPKPPRSGSSATLAMYAGVPTSDPSNSTPRGSTQTMFGKS